jgi:hypothetical protein
MLLSKLGVESLLVSALPSTSILPKAHVLNQRAMEILTDVGVANESTPRARRPSRCATPPTTPASRATIRCTAAQIGRLECWGAGGDDPDWASASKCRTANLPQIRLEPILKRGAEALAARTRALPPRARRPRAGRRRRHRDRPRQDAGERFACARATSSRATAAAPSGRSSASRSKARATSSASCRCT